MAQSKKEKVITFKVDKKLSLALQNIPNRSEFIRTAITNTLEHICPLCRGRGMLSQEQEKHWKTFSRTHKIEKCNTCDSFYLVCNKEKSENYHK